MAAKITDLAGSTEILPLQGLTLPPIFSSSRTILSTIIVTDPHFELDRGTDGWPDAATGPR